MADTIEIIGEMQSHSSQSRIPSIVNIKEMTHTDFKTRIRQLLKDNGKARSFWIDNVREFLGIDRIPQRLLDDLEKLSPSEILFIAEPWLRAGAERGYFEEEEGPLRIIDHFILQHPACRLFTAWVAAQNGHEQMVLELMITEFTHLAFIDLRVTFLKGTRSTWVYFIWQFLMQRGCFAAKKADISLWTQLMVERQIDGWTFLHCAAAWGDVTCIEELLKHYNSEGQRGVDSRTANEEEYSALHLAAYYDNVGIVNALLRRGADVKVRDSVTGRTPLHHASEQGCLASVKAFLEHAKEHANLNDVVEMVDDNGMTALHLASCRGEMEVVRELLSYTSKPPATYITLQSAAKDLTHEKAFTAHSLRRCRDLFSHVIYYRSLEATLNRNASTFLRPNRLKSQVWSPGGFSALHFAIVYGNNIDMIHEILQKCDDEETKEALVMTKDSLGLTPTDWAQVVDLKEAQEILELYSIKGQFSRKLTCINAKKAKRHYEEVKAAEQERRRLQWTLEISEALLCCEWDDVRRLTSNGVQQMKIKVDDCVWEHLEWAISVSLEYNLTATLREYRVSKVERMLLELVKGEAFSNNDSALQSCLMWAIQQEMVDLVEAIVRVKCELLSVTRGCHHKSSPLQAASDMKGERGSQLVAVMEQREDVQRRLYEDRQVYVDYANTILVGAVLIAALAYQGWVQKPQGYAAMPLNSDKYTKRMLVFAWCNSLGFFMSMGAVLAAAVAAMPLRRGRLVRFKEKSVRAGMVASVLMAASVACEVMGFAVAIVSVESHEKSMVRLASTSTIIVLMLLVWFFARVNELHPFLDFLLAFPTFLIHSRPCQRYVFNPFHVYVSYPLQRSSIISSTLCCFLASCSKLIAYLLHVLARRLVSFMEFLEEWADNVEYRAEILQKQAEQTT